MNLDTHISELLYRHDCVIVADFGGFVANYRPSFLHPSNHTIAPPSKRVAFNSGLTSNDGLLASYVAKQLKISYPEANAVIKEFRDECFSVLNEGGKLNLKKVGLLYLDAEKNVQFIPDATANYSLESFGFSTVHASIIKHDNDEQTIVQSFQQKEPKKWWRLLEVVPAAAAIALLLLYSQSVDSLVNRSLSSFNPIDYSQPLSSEIEYTTDSKTYDFENGIFSNAKQKPVPNDTVTEITTAIESNPQPTAVADEPVEAAIAETTLPKAEINTTVNVAVAGATQPTYYIIAGCFKIYENAVKFKDELIAKGYNAEIIGKHNGLNVVSCSALPNAGDAKTALDKIHTELDNGAWIMKK